MTWRLSVASCKTGIKILLKPQIDVISEFPPSPLFHFISFHFMQRAFHVPWPLLVPSTFCQRARWTYLSSASKQFFHTWTVKFNLASSPLAQRNRTTLKVITWILYIVFLCKGQVFLKQQKDITLCFTWLCQADTATWMNSSVWGRD